MSFLPSVFLFAVFLMTLLLGSALMHTGVQAWRTPTRKPWLARCFALLFTTFGGLLLLVSAASFIGWW